MSMLLTCPDCSTQFNVKDEALLPNGRKVKCGKCQCVWFQDPPRPEADGAADASAAPEAAPKIERDEPAFDSKKFDTLLQEHAQPPRKQPNWLAISGGIVAALFVLMMLMPSSVVGMWPASAKFYSMVGLEPPVLGEGLAFADVSIEVIQVPTTAPDAESEIVVSGMIVNNQGGVQDIPPLEAQVKTATNEVLDSIIFGAEAKRILPIESVPFKATLKVPAKADIAGVVVTFAHPATADKQ